MDTDVVLIVEDDATLLRGLQDNFRFKGYKVLTASDGRNGLDMALREHPDAIVLDIMMPEMDGYQVCKRIRGAGLEMPIIMLTAKGREEDIIRGLNAGAHDYMTKPFSIKELLARTSSLLKRYRRSVPDIFAFGECEVNMVSHKLFRNGDEVALTPKEFGLLIYFITHVGRALTRDDIMNEVWGSDILVTPRSVDRCINTLRQKVEPAGSRPVFIQTIRDIGYRFEVPEEHAVEAKSAVVVAPAESAKERSPAAASWAEDVVVGHFCLKASIDVDTWLATEGGREVRLYRLPWLVGHEEAQALLREHCEALGDVKTPVLNLGQRLVEIDGMPCYVERAFDGETLAARLLREVLDEEEALGLCLDLAGALKKAHKVEAYHGNISPETVLLCGDGPRLLQNGLAAARQRVFEKKMAQWDGLNVSVQSPQRLQGKPLTATDDVYALGVVHYAALAGVGPFDGEAPMAITARILTEEPEPLTEKGFGRKLWRIVGHALEKDADDRFQSARDLEFALGDLE